MGFGKKEDDEDINQLVQKDANPMQSKYSNFEMEKITFSLTRHQIVKPRVNLVCQDEYFIANNQLYKACEAVPLPKIAPGYNVDKFKEQEFRAHLFTLTQQKFRGLYFPEPVPSYVKVGSIQAFADVYEPMYCFVEQNGVVLSQQARMEMVCQDKRTIIPKQYQKKLQNVFQAEDVEFAKGFAEKGLKTNTYQLEAGKLGIQSLVSDIKTVFQIEDVETCAKEIQKITTELEKKENAQILNVLELHFVMFDYIKTYQGSNEEKLKQMKKLIQVIEWLRKNTKNQPRQRVKSSPPMDSIFSCKDGLSPISDVLASSKCFNQQEIKEIYDLECEIAGNKSTITEWYLSALDIALMHKNVQYVYFCIYHLANRPDIFGQLSVIALNNKLHAKDIKVSITNSKLTSTRFSALAFALFSCNRGFMQKMSEVADLSFEELSEEQKITITMAVCANVSDNIDLVKRAEELGVIVPAATQISALLAENKRVLSYVFYKYNKQEPCWNDYKRYLQEQHLNLLNEHVQVSAKVLELFSAKLSQQMKMKLIGQILKQGSLDLYFNDWVQQSVMNQEVQLLQMLMKLGYCFAYAKTLNYANISLISDMGYFQQLIFIISEHFRLTQTDASHVFSQLVCGCLENRDKIQIIGQTIGKLLSVQQKIESSQLIAENITRVPSPSVSFIVELCDLLEMPLINGVSVSTLNNLELKEDVALEPRIIADHYQVIEKIALNCGWQFTFVKLVTDFILQNKPQDNECSSTSIFIVKMLQQQVTTKNNEEAMLQSKQIDQNQLKALKEQRQILANSITALLKLDHIYDSENNGYEVNQNYLANSAHLLLPDQAKVFFSNIKKHFTQKLKPMKRSVFSFINVESNKDVFVQALQLNPSDQDENGKYSTTYMLENADLSNEEFTKQFISKIDDEQRTQGLFFALKKSMIGSPASRANRLQQFQNMKTAFKSSIFENRMSLFQARQQQVPQMANQKSAFQTIIDAVKQNVRDLKPLLQFTHEQQTLLHLVARMSTADITTLVNLYKSQRMMQIAGIADKDGHTPLMLYILNNQLFKDLDQELGQNFNQTNTHGDNILHLLIRKQPESFLMFSQRYDKNVCKSLLEQFNNHGSTPLHAGGLYQVAKAVGGYRAPITYEMNRDLMNCWQQAAKIADFAYISNQKTLYLSNMNVKLAELLFKAGCPLYDNVSPPLCMLNNMSGDIQESKQLFETCLNSLPIEQAIHVLLLLGRLDHQLIQKCPPIQSELFCQLILSKLAEIQLTINYWKSLLMKFGFKNCQEALKLINRNNVHTVIYTLVQMNLKLSEKDIYKLTDLQGCNFSDNFEYLLDENNVPGFFHALANSFRAYPNNYIVDHVLQHPQSDRSKEMIIQAICKLGHIDQQLNQPPCMRQQLMNYVLANRQDFSSLNLQQIVNSLEIKQLSAKEFMESLGVEYLIEQKTIPETELIDYELTREDIEIIKQDKRFDEQQATEISQIYSQKQGILHRNGVPLQLIGLNKRPYRCGIFLLFVKVQGRQYQLVKRFVNLPVFNQYLYINPQIFANQRKLKVIMQSENPDLVFKEFTKVIQQRSQQQFEQIVAEETSFSSVLGQKFTFYLYRQYVDLNSKDHTFVLEGVEKVQDKVKREYKDYIMHTSVQPLQFIEQNFELVSKFSQLPLKQQFNVYVHLFNFSKIPYQTSWMISDVQGLLSKYAVMARLMKDQQVLKLQKIQFLNKTLCFVQQQPNLLKLNTTFSYLNLQNCYREFSGINQDDMTQNYVCVGFSDAELGGFEINQFGCIKTGGQHGQVTNLLIGVFEE